MVGYLAIPINLPMTRLFLCLGALVALASCNSNSPNAKEQRIADMKRATDFHSYSKPSEAVTTHLSWEARVDFETRQIHATATYDMKLADDAERILLDARDLDIQQVTVDGATVDFELGPSRPFLGQPLSIPVSPSSEKVSVTYSTSPDAAAFLWVEGESPFLFTQSQAILARTWVPCQDSPGIRFTYDAEVSVPKELMALMSAVNPTEKSVDGSYRFEMNQPIPSYLLALAVGDVGFQSVGEHTGVYATPDLLDNAAYEFAEMEDMLVAAEALYGKYAWERYDLLVLPAAFPFGGMENLAFTFATPTIIAGDRSLVSLVAHELAQLERQFGDQRHVGRFLAQRRLHRVFRATHHGGRVWTRHQRNAQHLELPGLGGRGRRHHGRQPKRHPPSVAFARPRPRRRHDCHRLRQRILLP